MAQIHQNQDGSYGKTYSQMEMMLIKSLVDESKARALADQEIWGNVAVLNNRLEEIINRKDDTEFVQAEVVKTIGRVDEIEDKMKVYDDTIGKETMSKSEIESLITMWKVEEITHIHTQPTNAMFDRADMDKLKFGYKGYLMGNVYEPHDNHIPENTMQRYSINAFMERPEDVTFSLLFADRCTFMINGKIEGQWADTEGNFNTAAKVLTSSFKEGWNKVEVLISNNIQRGGLVIQSNLYEKSKYMNNLQELKGLVYGNKIAPGAINESHISPNMDLVVDTLRATKEGEPAIVVGNPNGCGAIQIGDKTITKCVDEPFIFDDGIRIDGQIIASQILFDKDFIMQGDGILISKHYDPITGFIEKYEVINNLAIYNEGGLSVTGDARKGFKLKNTMSLLVGAGLSIDGNAVDGYKIKNNMELTGEGVIITPSKVDDSYFNWHIVNDTKIKELNGIKVREDSVGEFSLGNVTTLTGKGIAIKGTGNVVDGFISWELTNESKIETTCGGLEIEETGDSQYNIKNSMKLIASKGGPITRILGDACKGYEIESEWPDLREGTGIQIESDGEGKFRIENTGVMRILAGDNVTITGSDSEPRINVDVPEVEMPEIPDLKFSSSDGSILISRNGDNIDLRLNGDMIPEVADPADKGSGVLNTSDHQEAATGVANGWRMTTTSAGMANATLKFNKSTMFKIIFYVIPRKKYRAILDVKTRASQGSDTSSLLQEVRINDSMKAFPDSTGAINSDVEEHEIIIRAEDVITGPDGSTYIALSIRSGSESLINGSENPYLYRFESYFVD